MSNIVSRGSDPDPKVKFLSIALAIVLALFWGFLIAGIWWFFNIKENVYEGTTLNWIARFHVIALHLPAGMIFFVIALELFGKVPGFHHIREASTFTLWLTLLGSIVTTILGFLLMEVEEVNGKAMTLHMWTGLGVVGLSVLALIFKLRGLGFVYGITLLASALCVAAAGHYGGAMVHGADYLADHAPGPVKKIILAGLSDGDEESPIADELVEVEVEERNVYSEYIHPILEKSCNECHNENKIKGKLRMDTHDLLMAGSDGSDYPTVVPGDSDESELIVRVTLDKDDDEFMPPKGDGLTADEINLLKLWIDAGAKTDITVSQLGDDPAILTTIAVVEALIAGEEVADIVEEVSWTSVWDGLSPEEQEARLAKLNTEAEQLNFSVMPVSAEDSRLHVNVLNGASEFGDEQLKLLEPVAERVLWLNLAKSQITDEGLDTVSKMRGLEKLHLENTKVTDAGIAKLTPLKELQYLNLYSTEVSNTIFESLKQLPNLRKLYVWQTKVDPDEARRYEESVNLQINTGIDLEKAAEEARAAKAAAEAEEAKKKAEEEAKKKALAEAAAKKKAAEEAAAKKKAAEEAAKKKAAEMAAAEKKAAEEAAKKKALEDAARKKQEADAAAAKAAAAKAAAEAKPAETPLPAAQ